MIYDTEKNDRQRWINQIKKYTNEKNDSNVIQYCLSWTLQCLKNGENMDKYKNGDDMK